MATRNKVILSGLAWRVYQGAPNLWKSVFHNKYKNHLAIRNSRHGISRTWKNIQDGWKSISSTTKWVVQKGEQVNFFHDNWLRYFVPLRHCIQGPLLEVEYNLTIVGLRLYHNWDLDRLSVAFLREIHGIIQDVVIYDNSSTRDKMVWAITPKRVYTTSSSYSHIASHTQTGQISQPSHDFKKIWRANIPNKIKHFLGFSAINGQKLIKDSTLWEC